LLKKIYHLVIKMKKILNHNKVLDNYLKEMVVKDSLWHKKINKILIKKNQLIVNKIILKVKIN
jgi:hypothetical protein